MSEQGAFKPHVFEANSIIFKEGQGATAAYLVSEGEVQIIKGAFSETPTVLATLGKGGVVGEMALFDNHPHIATAKATKETKVLAISREEFTKRVDTMDKVMKGIVLMMVKRLRTVSEQMSVKEGEAVNWADWKK
jgi:CRP/FNR family transcriptional regulator, cyclic AMP receptor protein